jgi:hypothetical protein
MSEDCRGDSDSTSAPPRTLQEALDGLRARGKPAQAEIIRIISDPDTFAVLVDRLPHAIETGQAARAIALLKMWGAWRDLYPLDSAFQALCRAGVG